MKSFTKNKRKHLRKEERFLIEKMLKVNKSFGYISNLLDRGVSTVSYEVNKNGGVSDYNSATAHNQALQRQRDKKLHLNKVLRNKKLRLIVDNYLSNKMSPETISKQLCRKKKSLHVSPKSIRKYIKQTLSHSINIDKH